MRRVAPEAQAQEPPEVKQPRPAPSAPSEADRQAAVSVLLTAQIGFLGRLRGRDQTWLESELPRYALTLKGGRAALGLGTSPATGVAGVTSTLAVVGAAGAIVKGTKGAQDAAGASAGAASATVTPGGDIAQVIANEIQLGQQFAEASARRLAANASMAAAIPDEAKRRAALNGALARERQYALQRSEAMAARAFAAVGRAALHSDSPQGAFWKLNPTVKDHTAGCLVMGEKFWPWVILDRVHPPRHAGCPCRLLSYSEARAAGHMHGVEIPNVADAIRMAAGVVMEAEMANALLDELALRDQLVEGGLATAEGLARIPWGVA